MAILVICSVLGVVAMVAAVMAWRGNRVALRVWPARSSSSP